MRIKGGEGDRNEHEGVDELVNEGVPDIERAVPVVLRSRAIDNVELLLSSFSSWYWSCFSPLYYGSQSRMST